MKFRHKDKWTRFLVGLLSLSVLVLSGCQQPTKVYETHELNIGPLVKGAQKPIVIDADTIVIDARSSFDFAMAHIPQAIHLNWEEFTESKGRKKQGRLQADLFRVTRRLARLGIHPGSKVVIVGYGPGGKGNAGRLAWTLYYLGVEDIQFASMMYFDLKLSHSTTLATPAAPMWKPKVVSKVLAERQEVIDAGVKRTSGKVYLIDVRSEKEYFGRHKVESNFTNPDLQALNIEWKQFINDKGRPNFNMKKELRGLGIGLGDRIIVISDLGVRSGAVTMALLSMGFRNSANFSEGLLNLTSDWRRSR